MSDAEKVIRVIGFGGEVIDWPVWEEKFLARSTRRKGYKKIVLGKETISTDTEFRQTERSNQVSDESLMALARTGGPKKASPKDCACEHESLLEMKEMQYLSSYCQPGKALHGRKCFNEDCDNGIVNAGWPKSPVWGGQAFCCEEILTMQGGGYACTFLVCIPCGIKMIEEIKAKGEEGGTNQRSRRNRK
jgi:hypothetical protein